MVSPQPSVQCADGGEEESRAPWPRQRGSVVSRHWTLQPTAADNFGLPDSTAQQPAAAECFDACSSSQCGDVCSRVMSWQWPDQGGRKFPLRNQEFRITLQ